MYKSNSATPVLSSFSLTLMFKVRLFSVVGRFANISYMVKAMVYVTVAISYMVIAMAYVTVAISYMVIAMAYVTVAISYMVIAMAYVTVAIS